MSNESEIAVISLGQCIDGLRNIYHKHPDEMRGVRLQVSGIEQSFEADELLAIAVIELKNMISVMQMDRKQNQQLRSRQ